MATARGLSRGRKVHGDALMSESERTKKRTISRQVNNLFRRKSKGGKGG